ELITAAALWLFADAGCEFAVLETGMGGRLDATNAIDCPELAVITPISMDHMEYLGATIAEIATEKAGIIKPGCTVCSAPQPLEAERVLRAHCTKVGSILSFARPQALERLGQDAHGQWLRHRPEMDGGDHGGNVGHDRSVRSDGSGGNGGSARLFLPLIGSHQIANAALALACVRTLRERGIRIDPEAVRDGLARTQWSGRMELVAETPAPIFLDGAHNVAGVQSAVDTLAELYGEKRILFVFGALKDKDVAGMRKVLEPRAKRIIRVTPNSSRAEDAGKTLAEGLAEALRCAGQDDIVCILGSLYLQKEDLQAFSTEPPPAPPAPTSPAAVLE
ncbi:MAG: hypothetical protein LBD12_07170, partial [Clostridiales Family XIII bacterium]|nr:hypothetical protein [Clostridiales Family XIII bacterium]